jgi:hypothetical protein
MRSHWLKIALFNFLLAALAGALLRYAFVVEIPWLHFRPMMHAHSHTAMLGWLYLGIFSLLIGTFLKPEQQAAPFYNRLFWATEVAVIGMFCTFPFYGYAGPSGGFAFLHVIFSWLFMWRFWRDLGGGAAFSARLVRTAFVFMALSALGILSLMVFAIGHFKHTGLFYQSIQFFLHFQFNGWFLFALLALFFRWLEDRGFEWEVKRLSAFYWLLVISNLLTYALAVAWSEPHIGVFAVNSAGVLLQMAALVVFFQLIWPRRREIIAPLDGWVRFLLILALLCFAGKILVQTAVAIPFVAQAAYTIRNYVIGFFHLILLGMSTSVILGYAIHKGWLSDRGLLARLGLGCWVVGFLGSELILFLQGTLFWGNMGFMPYYYESLFAVSALIPLGVGLILVGQWGRQSLLGAK